MRARLEAIVHTHPQREADLRALLAQVNANNWGPNHRK
jgi:mRNA-degrading endonuclease HigB of HigAB toxin-antitoxin module